MHQHLLDSDYDCDRLDYILRDAAQTGVGYGHIDLTYLIENMSKRRDPPHLGVEVLAIHKRRALHTLEQYLTSRYYMYSQVIHHKTIKSLELMARAIFYQLSLKGMVVRSFDEIRQMIPTDRFLMFDDTYFYNALNTYYEKSDGASSSDRLAQLIHRLLFWNEAMCGDPLPMVREWRKIWDRTLGQSDSEYTHVHSLIEKPRILEDICRKANLDPSSVVVEEVPVDFLPVGKNVHFSQLFQAPNEKGIAALRRSPRLYDEQSDKLHWLIDDPSTILSVLSKVELRIIRIFTTETDEHAIKAFGSALDEHFS